MTTKTRRTMRSAAISVIACLALGAATPSFAGQFETIARSYERGELDKTSEDSFPDSATFDQPVYVDVEDIALMRKLVLAWDGIGIGAPQVSPLSLSPHVRRQLSAALRVRMTVADS
ncbi:hypothetical protein [Mesorhizobium sp.]|uniref:hypothetical protein n=1 Tax=Mesorhizobium sp. TaxID=1871066 RepID=UPI00257B370D|nr:hypothetical protein [Mesorhizobium sp.]